MAFASDSTTAPARPLLPLPALDRRAIGRDGWARAREIASRLGGEIRDHVAEGMRQAWVAARAMLQAASAPTANDATALASESVSAASAFDSPAQDRSVEEVGVSDVVANHPDAPGAVPPLLPLPAPLPSLSTSLSRRRAVFGAVAVAAVPAVALPAAAAAVKAEPTISAEAKALQSELARVSSEYRTACRLADEASARVEYPDPPEALYVRPGDLRMFARQPEPSWSDKADGREWWADPPTVERLRGDTFWYLGGRQDEIACARRDEVVAAFDQWVLDDRAAEDAAGYTAAQERFEAAFYAYQALRIRLVELRTDDPEVLTVKGLAVVELLGRDAGRLDALIARAAEREGGPNETAMALSMARDFIALFGHSVWVSA